MVKSEDFGNLENLVSYLNGKDPFEERIKNARRIYFIAVKVPPQHKEEVVISWLTDIISREKAFTYSENQLCLVWKILHAVICSKRTKALCSSNWVCSFTSDFIQCLINAVSVKTTDFEIQELSASILEFLLLNPCISPQVKQLSNQSINLYESILAWANTETINEHFALIKVLLENCKFQITARVNTYNIFTAMFEKILLPTFKLSVALQEYSSPQNKELLIEIKNFISTTIYAKGLENLYAAILQQPLNKGAEALNLQGEYFYKFLGNCLKEQDHEIAAYLLGEFTAGFFLAYKNHENTSYKYLVVVMHMLGVQLMSGPRVEENNLASHAVKPLLSMTKTHKEEFIYVLLQCIFYVELNLSQSLAGVSLKLWLKKLFQLFLQEPSTQLTLKILSILIKIDPSLVTDSYSVFANLLNREANTECTNKLKDELFCEILDIHERLRTIDSLLKDLIRCFINTEISKNILLNNDKPFTFYGAQIFPCSFMKNLVYSIKMMGTQLWLSFCSELDKIISSLCFEELKKGNDGVFVAIWLSALSLQSFPVIGAVNVVSIVPKIVAMMNSFAKILSIFVDQIIKQKNTLDSFVFQSLLYMIFTWSEIHMNLLSTDTGYVEQTEIPKTSVLNCPDFTDFSAQASFIDRKQWKKFMKKINLEEDSEKVLVLNLLIQKLCLLEMSSDDLEKNSKNLCLKKMTPTSTENIDTDLEVDNIETDILDIDKVIDSKVDEEHGIISKIRNSSLDFILNMDALEKFPCTSDTVALHLPMLLTLIRKCDHVQMNEYYDCLTRLFISGITCRREAWIKFSQSSYFKSDQIFHRSIFKRICTDFISIMIKGKKVQKIDDKNEKLSEKQLIPALLQSLIEFKFGKTKKDTDEFWVKAFRSLVSILKVKDFDKIENFNSKKLGKISKRAEVDILNLLSILEILPCVEQSKSLNLSLFILSSCVFQQEGGVIGRFSVVSKLLNILIKFSYNHAELVFKYCKNISLLLYFLKESGHLSEQLHDDYFFICTNSNVSKFDIFRSDLNVNTKLAFLVRSFTSAFLSWSPKGFKMRNFVENVKKMSEKEEEMSSNKNFEINMMISIFVIVQFIRKKLIDSPSNQTITECLPMIKRLNKWFLKLSKKDVTPPVLMTILSTFNLVLETKKLKLSMTKIPTGKKRRKLFKNLQTNAIKKQKIDEKTSVDKPCEAQEEVSLNFDKVINRGLLVISKLYKISSLPKALQEMCFNFSVSVLYFQKHLKNQNSKTNFKSQNSRKKVKQSKLKQKQLEISENCVEKLKLSTDFEAIEPAVSKVAWSVICHTDLKPELISEFMAVVSLENKKQFRDEIMTDTRNTLGDVETLNKWFCLIKSRTIYTEKKVELVEQFISTISLYVSNREKEYYSSNHFRRVISILLIVIKDKIKVSISSKSSILQSCCKIDSFQSDLQNYFSENFTKFCSILNNLLLQNDYSEFVTSRPTAIMTCLECLVGVLTKQTCAKLQTGTPVQDAELCCSSLEAVVRNVKRFDYHFSKILPMCVGKFVLFMQEHPPSPAVKNCIEHICYTLLDISDGHVMRHAYVTFPTAVTATLKNIQAMYSHCSFNPKTD